MLRKAKIIGVDEIVFTILKSNIPSISVAEYNGGIKKEKDKDWVYYYFDKKITRVCNRLSVNPNQLVNLGKIVDY